MDAKARADFLASIAAGEAVECPNCGEISPAGKKFCRACGYSFASGETSATKQEVSPTLGAAFGSVDEASQPKQKDRVSAPAFSSVGAQTAAAKAPKAEPDPVSAFAQGLPSWSITPPQTPVRRKGKRRA